MRSWVLKDSKQYRYELGKDFKEKESNETYASQERAHRDQDKCALNIFAFL